MTIKKKNNLKGYLQYLLYTKNKTSPDCQKTLSYFMSAGKYNSNISKNYHLAFELFKAFLISLEFIYFFDDFINDNFVR